MGEGSCARGGNPSDVLLRLARGSSFPPALCDDSQFPADLCKSRYGPFELFPPVTR